jgi:hypothetical protein
MDLSDEEKRAIASLKRLAKRWPDTLWLFCGGQKGIAVMKAGVDGERVTTGVGEGFDPGYLVDQVDMPVEGGDW